jgi:hypothetical protein
VKAEKESEKYTRVVMTVDAITTTLVMQTYENGFIVLQVLNVLHVIITEFATHLMANII